MENNQFTSLNLGKYNIDIYNPREKAIFPISSSIISGEKEVILIDAQFQKNDAENIVKKIKETGKTLTTVLVTHCDPDFYFGLDVIIKNFPDVKVLSTPQVAYLINASKDAKIAVWKDALGENAPEELFTPSPINTNIIELEGLKIEIKQDENDPDHIYLWIPEFKIILGGVSITTGTHVWIADSQKDGDLEKWSAKLDEMKALNPSKIIPGHSLYTGDKFTDVAGLDELKEYLDYIIKVKKTAKTSTEFIAEVKNKYPNLPSESSLEMGAKVLTGEMPWETLGSFPAINHKIKVNFGELSYELNFKDNKSMSFVGLTESTKNDTDDVQYTAVEVADKVFMVYWQEPKLKARVVHVQDYGKNTVYTNIAAANGDFYNLKGTLEILK